MAIALGRRTRREKQSCSGKYTTSFSEHFMGVCAIPNPTLLTDTHTLRNHAMGCIGSELAT